MSEVAKVVETIPGTTGTTFIVLTKTDELVYAVRTALEKANSPLGPVVVLMTRVRVEARHDTESQILHPGHYIEEKHPEVKFHSGGQYHKSVTKFLAVGPAASEADIVKSVTPDLYGKLVAFIEDAFSIKVDDAQRETLVAALVAQVIPPYQSAPKPESLKKSYGDKIIAFPGVELPGDLVIGDQSDEDGCPNDE